MNGIILELQQDLLSKDCDVLNALRKAHIIAAKLKLKDFDKWICNELNGYKDQKEVPDYRKIKGTLKGLNPYSGWMPTMIPDASLENTICSRNITNSISSLLELYAKSSSSNIQMSFPGDLLKILNNIFDFPIETQFTLFIDSSAIKEIIEHVKDALLQWTLKLEANNIIGKDLSFTPQEKEKAQSLPQTIINYNGITNVIAAHAANTQISIGDNNSIVFDYGNGKNAVAEIKKSIEQEEIEQEDKNEALKLLKEINSKIRKKKKPSIIKSAFSALKDFLISVGASITVSLIEAKMNGLF